MAARRLQEPVLDLSGLAVLTQRGPTLRSTRRGAFAVSAWGRTANPGEGNDRPCAYSSGVTPSSHALHSDENAIRAWLRGDSNAATVLLEKYHKELSRFFRRHHAGQAEDLTQQVLIAAVQAVRRLGTNMDFRAYVFAIARRTSARAYSVRRAERGGVEVPLEDATDELLLRCEPLESGQEAAWLRARLDTLPECYRTALELYYLHETGAREIAALLRVPIPTVRSRVRRGLEQLRRSMVVGRQLWAE